MKSDDFDFFYSSDLGRAMHTSRLVGGSFRMEGHSPRRLALERDLGVLEALTTEEMLEREPRNLPVFPQRWTRTRSSRRGELQSVLRPLLEGGGGNCSLVTREQKLAS